MQYPAIKNSEIDTIDLKYICHILCKFVKKSLLKWISSTWFEKNIPTVEDLTKIETDKAYDIAGYLLARLLKFATRKFVASDGDQHLIKLFVTGCSYETDDNNTAFQQADSDNLPVTLVFHTNQYNEKMFVRSHFLDFIVEIGKLFKAHVTVEYLLDEYHTDPTNLIRSIIVCNDDVQSSYYP